MLLSFSFENFLSFRDKVKITFQGGTIKEKQENVYYPHFDTGLKILKSLALYGPNSSGKSNVIKAFAFFRHFVITSSNDSNVAKNIPVTPFLLSEKTETKPSMFEATFFIQGEKYRYGFQTTKYCIESEWLFSYPSRKEEKLFIRAKQEFSFDKRFHTANKAKLETLAEFVRPNALYLSVLAQFNFQLGAAIVKWLDNILIAADSDHEGLIHYTASLLENDAYRKFINDIMRNSDLSIQGVESRVDELSAKLNYSPGFLQTALGSDLKKYIVSTRHSKYNAFEKVIEHVLFDLIRNESLGTQKFFGILGPVLIALKETKVLWVDEIDARLHPGLLENIIQLFNSAKYNPNGAQLVFTSHNTRLLKDDLRRDQMILVEKQEGEYSTVESLYSKNPSIRNDAAFEKDYLAGKYGAIPVFPTQLNLFEG